MTTTLKPRVEVQIEEFMKRKSDEFPELHIEEYRHGATYKTKARFHQLLGSV